MNFFKLYWSKKKTVEITFIESEISEAISKPLDSGEQKKQPASKLDADSSAIRSRTKDVEVYAGN